MKQSFDEVNHKKKPISKMVDNWRPKMKTRFVQTEIDHLLFLRLKAISALEKVTIKEILRQSLEDFLKQKGLEATTPQTNKKESKYYVTEKTCKEN